MAGVDFTHQALRTRLVCRPGAALALADELAHLGCRRPLILTSKSMRAHSLYADLLLLLSDVAVAEFDNIPQHSDLEMIGRVTERMNFHEADCVVAVGGGSVSDSAKAAALLFAEGGTLRDLASRFILPATIVAPDLLRPKVPIISIPTTASAAEVTPSFGVRTPEGEKLLFWDPQLASRVILLDAKLNLSIPAPLMLATGMNGLAHCLEGLYSTSRSPISTSLALEGIRRFDHALRAVARDPESIEYRVELLVAAHLSGMVLASARSCLHHAVCHVIGATCGVPHGLANTVMLPHTVRFNQSAAPDCLSPIEAVLGESLSALPPGDDGFLFSWLANLQAECRLPGSLRDIGVAREALPDIARKTMHERGLAFNPRPVNKPDDIEAILDAAW
ncbi:iron-containing alcohol dehydrogenase [Paralcaligenes sp. KSB-10]|uniref:iron-containing alcohol dehydrogenase family protein n=1 Tax=Paralcaligenes sp. KSB-10 TaxID=2901142 RepID=UPI001E453645|nr:iron-containing alcohol dehydrogenase [Paralcaligenes sp. KSB-10]UHL64014.1 iron-containing alcohol dehydrogenase [Paralcaligenes sp. KSB-10]